MRLLRFIFMAFTCLYLQGCIMTQVASIDAVSSKILPVSTTNGSDRAYKELKHIEAAGSIFHRNQRLLEKLAMRAKKEGADAVVNVNFRYLGFAPYVTGVAVKYNK